MYGSDKQTETSKNHHTASQEYCDAVEMDQKAGRRRKDRRTSGDRPVKRGLLTNVHKIPISTMPTVQSTKIVELAETKEIIEFGRFGQRRSWEAMETVEKQPIEDHTSP